MSISWRTKMTENKIGDAFWVDPALPNGLVSVNIQSKKFDGIDSAGSLFSPEECREMARNLLDVADEQEENYRAWVERMESQ